MGPLAPLVRKSVLTENSVPETENVKATEQEKATEHVNVTKDILENTVMDVKKSDTFKRNPIFWSKMSLNVNLVIGPVLTNVLELVQISVLGAKKVTVCIQSWAVLISTSVQPAAARSMEPNPERHRRRVARANFVSILMEIINARNVISRVQLAMVTVPTPVMSALMDILKIRTMFASLRKQLVKLLT